MSVPPLPSPWVFDDVHHNPPVYTRPLIGSELFLQRWQNSYNGKVEHELCGGVTFTSSLGIGVLRVRACEALHKLRFVCPIIACDIENDADTPRWVYTPSADRDAWFELALVVEERELSLDPRRFIQETVLKRLPYRDGKGTVTLFRAYLLTTSSSDGANSTSDENFALFLHGPHAMFDGAPMIHAVNLMCEWMSAEGRDVKIEPREEWKNLPVDPVTATGGPAQEWGTDGIKLLQETTENTTRRSFLPSIGVPPRAPNVLAPSSFSNRILSETATVAVISKAKQLGFSMSTLFHVAFCLTMLKMNPLPEGTSEVDFSPDWLEVSLEPYFKLPVNSKTHLISSMSMMPTRFSITEALRQQNEKDRLIMIGKLLQERIHKCRANPCLPQLLSVLASMTPYTPSHDDSKVPSIGTLQSLGAVDSVIKPRHKNLTVGGISFGLRLQASLHCHVWTWGSKLHIQVQGASAWGDECTNKLAEEIERLTLLILDAGDGEREQGWVIHHGVKARL